MDGRSLIALGEEHLAAAKGSRNGRSAGTLFGGRQHDMRQTLIALTAGTALHEHDSPGEATVQVLTGNVRVTAHKAAGADTWEGGAGDYLVIPPQRHNLEALSDAVVLLTVATRA